MLRHLRRWEQADPDAIVQPIAHDYRTEDPHGYMQAWSEDIWVGDVVSAGSRACEFTPGMTVMFPEFNATPIGVEGFCLLKSDGVLAVLED